MNLTVFGATGGVGREVVTQALDAGHHVIAQVRNPARLTFSARRTSPTTAKTNSGPQSSSHRLRPATRH
jgi:uncharacterized protein YbjT (DUF2867 family)